MNTTIATMNYTRPENRCRGHAQPWADVLPDAYRSEAFAEDLDGPAELAVPRAAAGGRGPAFGWLLGLVPAAR